MEIVKNKIAWNHLEVERVLWNYSAIGQYIKTELFDRINTPVFLNVYPIMVSIIDQLKDKIKDEGW